LFWRDWFKSSIKMWLEIIIGIIIWCVVVWFGLKILEEFNLKKLKRRYNEEDDPGFKAGPGTLPEEGVGFRTGGSDSKGEPDIQDAIEHAKQELLQSGIDRVDDNDAKPAGPNKPDPKPKVGGSKQDTT
jgi:hypothetical protein